MWPKHTMVPENSAEVFKKWCHFTQEPKPLREQPLSSCPPPPLIKIWAAISTSSVFLLSMSHFSFWCGSLKRKDLDWLCPATRLWLLISPSVLSAQQGCLWIPLWPSLLLTRTARKRTCAAESYLCIFPRQLLNPGACSEQKCQAQRDLVWRAGGFTQHGNQIWAQESTLDGTGTGLSPQLELQFNLLEWHSVDGNTWYSPFLTFFFFSL